MSGQSLTAFLLSCVLLAIFYVPWNAFLEVAPSTPEALSVSGVLGTPQRPRFLAPESRNADSNWMMPLAGVAAVSGLLAAAIVRGSRVRCYANRVKFSRNQTAVIPSGTEIKMTKEEEAKWLETTVKELEELLPMSKEEFEDEVDELTWQWARHLLPFTDKRRATTAQYKRKILNRQRELFEQARLFKPLLMKYPSHAPLLCPLEYPSLENKSLKLNAKWIRNEQNIAGFTYKDFLSQTNNNKFDLWETPSIGDTVEGTVVAISEDGAFVEIGGKTWALLPTKNCSLLPLSSASEVLKVGQNISAQVVEMGLGSKVPGDATATQVILSVRELSRVQAWNYARAALNAEEGTDPIYKVTVISVQQWGAVVQTEAGLMGMIPNQELSNLAGNSGSVGLQLEVAIMRVVDENIYNDNPRSPGDFPLVFSYKNTANKVLAKKLKAGMVVAGKITGIRPVSVDVEVMGQQVTMKKADMSSNLLFNVENLFALGEEIKAYVYSLNEDSGDIRLSTKALEYKPGYMLTKKKKVFEKAEETAALFFKKEDTARQEAMTKIADALADNVGDEEI